MNISEKRSNKNIIYIYIIIFIILDQILKLLATKGLSKYGTLPIIRSVLHLTYVENYGAAFGMFQREKFFLILITSLILVSLIIFTIYNKKDNNVFLWSLSLIISGGIGNLIDRIFRGYVIDYIDFRLIKLAVFNLADSFVFIGVCMMVMHVFLVESKGNKNE